MHFVNAGAVVVNCGEAMALIAAPHTGTCHPSVCVPQLTRRCATTVQRWCIEIVTPVEQPVEAGHDNTGCEAQGGKLASL